MVQAEYCANYTTAGTKVGDWFLPSGKQFNFIKDAKVDFDKAFALLKKTTKLTVDCYWTSDKNDDTEAMCTAGFYYYVLPKTQSCNVSPIIHY